MMRSKRIIREDGKQRAVCPSGLTNHGQRNDFQPVRYAKDYAGAGTLQSLFLDSMTIGSQRAMQHPYGCESDRSASVPRRYAKRGGYPPSVYRAIELARRNGSAIAIGHPHPATVRVLQQMVYRLPADIT